MATPPTPKPIDLPPDAHEAGRRPPTTRLRQKLALVVGSVAVVLLGFEGFYRLRRWARNRDDARFSLDHNWMREILRPGWSDPDGRIHVNSLGFRGEQVNRAKPTRGIRIVCLGGSTTFGFYLHDHETWPYQLQQRLRKAFPKQQIEVINAGCPGYNTYVSYVNLRTRLIHLCPDIVIICHLHNDARHSLVNRASVDRRVDPQAWYPNLMARDGFDCWIWQSLLVSRILNRLGRRKSMTEKEFARFYPVMREQYEHNMNCMVRFCRKAQVRPVLSTYAHCIDPTLPEDELHKRAEATLRNFRFLTVLQSLRVYHGFNDVVRQIAKREGVVLVDNADPKRVPREEKLFRDSVHFTAAGASRVAASTFERVRVVVAALVRGGSDTP